jgi:hypothetical protein
MSRYSRSYIHPAAKPRPWQIHPIWRGIGCLLVILLPIIAYSGGVMLVRANTEQRWVSLPGELLGFFSLPAIGRVYYADLAATAALLILGFGVLTVVYSFVYRLFGPPRYSPLDAPMPKPPPKRW